MKEQEIQENRFEMNEDLFNMNIESITEMRQRMHPLIVGIGFHRASIYQ